MAYLIIALNKYYHLARAQAHQSTADAITVTCQLKQHRPIVGGLVLDPSAYWSVTLAIFKDSCHARLIFGSRRQDQTANSHY